MDKQNAQRKGRQAGVALRVFEHSEALRMIIMLAGGHITPGKFRQVWWSLIQK